MFASKFRMIQRIQRIMSCIQYRPYARGRKQNVPPWRPAFGKQDLSNVEFGDLMDMEHMENLGDTERLERATKKKIAFKTVERKFFRSPQELNLLFWAAKEQIRFLSQEFPDEWTPRRISQSFPISEDGVIKLLKSKRLFDGIDDVIKHDRKVHDNWLALRHMHRGKERGESDMVINKYLALKKNGQLHLLNNAAGITKLPKPDLERIFDSRHHSHNKLPGLYESIVKGYCEQKKYLESAENFGVVSQNDTDTLIDHMGRNKMYVELISGEIQVKEQKSDDEINGESRNARARIDYQHAFQNKMSPIKSKENIFNDSNSIKEVDSNATKYSDMPSTTSQKTKISLRRVKNESSSLQELDSSKENSAEICMSDEAVEDVHSDGIEEFPRDKSFNTNIYKKEQYIYKHIRKEEVTLRNSKSIEQAYLYDPTNGYNYPFGKIIQSFPEKIQVPTKNRNPEKDTILYENSKCIYDEDGEFLYKRP